MNFVKSKDDSIIAYDVYGSGSVMIYITGAICHIKFQPIIDDANVFSKHFKVYNYDRRGRGDSTDKGTYTIESEINDLEALVNVTKEKEYQIIKENISKILKEGNYSKAIKTFLVSIGMPWFFTLIMPLIQGWKRSVSLAPTLLYDIQLTEKLPPLDRLKKITIPVLVACGGKSPQSIKDVSGQIHKTIKNSIFKSIEGQDHMINPKVILNEILIFSNSIVN